MSDISFANIAVVACGTMSLELNYLKQEDFPIRIICCGLLFHGRECSSSIDACGHVPGPESVVDVDRRNI